jgi:hypothetical protein
MSNWANPVDVQRSRYELIGHLTGASHEGDVNTDRVINVPSQDTERARALAAAYTERHRQQDRRVWSPKVHGGHSTPPAMSRQSNCI